MHIYQNYIKITNVKQTILTRKSELCDSETVRGSLVAFDLIVKGCCIFLPYFLCPNSPFLELYNNLQPTSEYNLNNL